ncbi:MAG: FAD:protein FMN transferase, partial [Coriobacteriia bacterium]|nr:FAD:protein FMN transferase [Coriobacteriia bacterium]
EVREYFSPQLRGVTAAWAFESGGQVPSAGELAAALTDPRYDFGGAAKGLALDEAAATLLDSRVVDAALITAGSTTVTLGSKPDGEPWRIGVEHPREPGETIATIESPGTISVSTSGDYQRFFERDGARYHHILDPATGLPARGLQSLTVIGEIPGLASDILSTALFVAGPDVAISYAEENGLGLVLVDDEGRIQIVPGPDNASWTILD